MLRKGVVLVWAVLLLLSGSMTAMASAKTEGIEGITPSGIQLTELEAFVDRYAEAYIGKQTVGASVAVVKDGSVVLAKGYGYADTGQQLPVTPDTVMEWGSISKLVVWTSVMQLQEQGKLDLNEDIRTYLPDAFLTRLTFDDPITMLHLMNHNAGFEEYMFDMAYQSPGEVRSLEEGLRLAQPAQIFRPGEVVAYSNYGSSLAAYIVERISGQPFHEYAQQHVLDPLGMEDTIAHSVAEERPELAERKAKGYFAAGEGAFAEGSWNYMSMYPNGGNNGTAEDLARFAMALLPPEGEPSPLFQKRGTLDQMLAQSYAAGEGMPGIAHGFWEYPGVYRTLGHGGNTIAFSTNMQLVPEERFAIVVMANQAGESHLVHGLAGEVLGRQQHPEAVALPDASDVQGEYVAARRPGYGFMNLFPYLTMMKLEPQGPGELQMTLSGLSASYKQVQPYLYEKVSGDAALDVFPMLYAKVDDGRVAAISVYTSDYLPLSAGKSMPVLVTCAVLAALAGVYFVTAPFVLAVRAWMNKRRARTRPSSRGGSGKLLTGFTLTGTGIVANNLILALRMLSNNERAYAEVYPQILVNYGLTGLAVLLLAGLLLAGRLNRPGHSGRPLRHIILPAAMMTILIGLLVFWQFYS